LSDGRSGPRVDPLGGARDARAAQIQEVCPVPSTGLALMRRTRLDWDADDYGAVFSLLDRDARPVWHLDWSTDYTVRGDPKDYHLIDEMRKNLAILAVSPSRFTLRQVASNERVTFAVEHVHGSREGWDVHEVGREPFVHTEPTANEAEHPIET